MAQGNVPGSVCLSPEAGRTLFALIGGAKGVILWAILEAGGRPEVAVPLNVAELAKKTGLARPNLERAKAELLGLGVIHRNDVGHYRVEVDPDMLSPDAFLGKPRLRAYGRPGFEAEYQNRYASADLANREDSGLYQNRYYSPDSASQSRQDSIKIDTHRARRALARSGKFNSLSPERESKSLPERKREFAREIESSPQREPADLARVEEACAILGREMHTERVGMDLGANHHKPDAMRIAGWQFVEAAHNQVRASLERSKASSFAYFLATARNMTEDTVREREAAAQKSINGHTAHTRPQSNPNALTDAIRANIERKRLANGST